MNRIARRLLQISFAVPCMMLCLPAGAHYLWLQHEKTNGHLYFGEYEETLRERSPGRLDEMPGPQIRALARDGKAVSLPATREAGGFRFAMPASNATVLAIEPGYAVKDWRKYNNGIVKPMFYARLAGEPALAQKETLPLDIVPTGKAGEFRVLFKDAPLAATEVRVIAPNAWVRETKTDKDGVVRFELPWRGQYLLHAVHLERSAGVFESKEYEAIRHRTTTSVTVRTGAPTTVPTSWQASGAE